MRDANFVAVRRIVFMLAALIALTLAAYWPVYHYGFVAFDDGSYIYQNTRLQGGLTRAGWHFAFTTYLMGNWNPLLWLSFFLDRALFNLRPGPMHVENVLLHLISGILLWRLLTLATGQLNRSWFVAALFLLHPMHVESVAWITERKDVLSTPLLIAAMICYVRFTQQRRTPVLRYSEEPDVSPVESRSSEYLRTGVWEVWKVWGIYLAMIVLYALSLMCKTMGVTLPAVLILLDYWPLKRWPSRSWFRLVIEKIPLLILAVAGSVIGGIAQSKIGTTTSLKELSLLDRIDNAVVCYAIYTVKLIVPTHLAVFYPHPHSRPAAAVVAAGLLLFLATLLFLRLGRTHPWLIVGWFWFLGTLLPVIGLVQIGGQAMADRYSYFPSIGLLVVVVWGCGSLLHRFTNASRQPSWQSRFAAGMMLAILALFTVVTAIQVTYWKDSQTLFTHALNVTDDNPVVHVVLANVAFEKHDMVVAVDQCHAALRLSPYARAYFALGRCWINDDPDKACGYFQKAVDLQPQAVEYRTELAKGLRIAKRFPEARQQAKTALALDPDDPDAQQELKNILAAEQTKS